MLTTHQEQLLAKNANEYLARSRHVIDKHDSRHIMLDGKQLINFCSNDYLGLASHPAVINAFIQGANDYGLGSGSSALISGYSKAHHALEEAFAFFLQRDRAILFNSGYHANLGVIATLANRNSCVITDKLCHASIIDGIVLARAKCLRYRHNDLVHAETLLKNNSAQHMLIVTESVFSMEGDTPDIKALCSLAKKYHATLIIDDAHGIGVNEFANLSQQEVPCLVTPLGKAVGSMGAIVAGSTDLIEMLLQFSRTYRYSTALPPAVCHATITALAIMQSESWRRQKLHDNINFFHQQAKLRNINPVSTDATPIKSIIIGANKTTLLIQKELHEQGFFVSCIRPPTVPVNTARIRLSLNCMQTTDDIIRLLDSLKNAIARTRCKPEH